MRILLTIIFILCFIPNATANILTGGIEYNTNSARAYLLYSEKQTVPEKLLSQNLIDLNRNENITTLLKGSTQLNDRTLAYFSDGSYAVTYNNNPKYVWYYARSGILTHSEVKETFTYPYKTYKYNPDKSLENMSLRVSKEETYIFSPKGKLLAHWLGPNCYDENGNIVMTREYKIPNN